MSFTAKILNGIGNRVARIEFDRNEEKKVIEMLRKAGFEVDVPYGVEF